MNADSLASARELCERYNAGVNDGASEVLEWVADITTDENLRRLALDYLAVIQEHRE